MKNKEIWVRVENVERDLVVVGLLVELRHTATVFAKDLL